MPHATQLHGQPDPQSSEYLAGWQRARAELDNFRKQIQAHQAHDRQHQLRVIIEPLLTLADNFKAVILHVPPQLQADPWVKGVLHVSRQFEATLKEYGVTPMGEIKQQFDPAKHEAIAQVKNTNHSVGTITEVVQPGYVLNDHVIRPAKVKVAAE